ncbi:MAG TPA: FTR1 family protein [Anaerolineaceae bacterium]|nr:FTR1 family protein [Anaerolineaceae bacterium]
MLPSFVLSLREGLEAALVIGLVLGALKRVEKNELRPVVWLGIGIAIFVSLALAVALNLVDIEFEGTREAVFEAVSMLFAAILLTWMIFWMSRQARTLRQEIEADVRKATLQPGRFALFFLAFFAVLREGVELALFLLAARLASNPVQTVTGSALGLGLATLLGIALFSATYRLNLRRFFQFTNVLLIVFAAGLVAHGVRELNGIGWVPALVNPIWDINFILSNQSPLGEFLGALVGYNGSPSLSEALAYGAYFICLAIVAVFGFRRPAPNKSHRV